MAIAVVVWLVIIADSVADVRMGLGTCKGRRVAYSKGPRGPLPSGASRVVLVLRTTSESMVWLTSASADDATNRRPSFERKCIFIVVDVMCIERNIRIGCR